MPDAKEYVASAQDKYKRGDLQGAIEDYRKLLALNIAVKKHISSGDLSYP